jgi:hypothetical protein
MKVNLVIDQESKADDQLEVAAVAEVSFKQKGIFEHFSLNLKINGNRMLDLLRWCILKPFNDSGLIVNNTRQFPAVGYSFAEFLIGQNPGLYFSIH